MGMLKVTNLNAGYQDLPVLKEADLTLKRGKIGVLMGPNGAGKSTLLKSVFNLVDVFSGDISFMGENLRGLATHELLSHGIAYVPQGKINFGTLTVEENLYLGAYGLRKRGDIAEHARRVYGQFPALKEKRQEYGFALSGGQQQMLALGRAMMLAPQLLLLDEPSLGLSPKLVKEVFASIKKINEQFGTTILIVEHNIKSVLNIADYGFVMVGGKMLAQDTADNLKRSDILQKVFVGKFE